MNNTLHIPKSVLVSSNLLLSHQGALLWACCCCCCWMLIMSIAKCCLLSLTSAGSLHFMGVRSQTVPPHAGCFNCTISLRRCQYRYQIRVTLKWKSRQRKSNIDTKFRIGHQDLACKSSQVCAAAAASDIGVVPAVFNFRQKLSLFCILSHRFIQI